MDDQDALGDERAPDGDAGGGLELGGGEAREDVNLAERTDQPVHHQRAIKTYPTFRRHAPLST